VIYGGIAFDCGSGQSSPFGLTLNGKSQAPLKVGSVWILFSLQLSK